MPAPRSVLLNMEITEAQREHGCRFNKSHRIVKGDRRLTIKVDGEPQNYCLPCAALFMEKSSERLSTLRAEVSALLAQAANAA